MPPILQGADTPMKAVVQRGLVLYSQDMTGELTYLCETADMVVASWIAWCLATYNDVPHEVQEPEEPRLSGILQVQGNFNDPEFQRLIKAVETCGYQQAPDRQITEAERRDAARKVLEGDLGTDAYRKKFHGATADGRPA